MEAARSGIAAQQPSNGGEWEDLPEEEPLGASEISGGAAVVPVLAAAGRTTGPAMRRSNPVEEAAMTHAMASEQEQGRQVADVHAEDRGYDLVSRGAAGQVRYIEVKGRAGVGDVELSHNEWLKAQQLGDDYWLYVVSNALTAPDLQPLQNPAQRMRSRMRQATLR